MQIVDVVPLTKTIHHTPVCIWHCKPLTIPRANVDIDWAEVIVLLMTWCPAARHLFRKQEISLVIRNKQGFASKTQSDTAYHMTWTDSWITQQHFQFQTAAIVQQSNQQVLQIVTRNTEGTDCALVKTTILAFSASTNSCHNSQYLTEIQTRHLQILVMSFITPPTCSDLYPAYGWIILVTLPFT